MTRYLQALPVAPPAFACGIAIAVVLSRPIARRIDERRATVFVWLVCLALILSLTLTPASSAFSADALLPTTRVWTRGLPSPGAITSVNWQSMNLLMFAPIGIASGLFSRLRMISWATATALGVSVAVELGQYAVTALGRSQFNSATVVIGWCGIGLGLVLGLAVRTLLARLNRGRSRTPE